MENRIYVSGQEGQIKAEHSGQNEVVLGWQGEYVPGDVIVMEFTNPGYYAIRVDDCVDEAMVYMAEKTLRYPVIFDEKKLAHNPKAFSGGRHYLALRPAYLWELGYWDLAKNPADQHDVKNCYPHASANVETRG